MSNKHPPLEAVVWGQLACFTRPECKVERVSYPVMTPSAARGVLEAIFWKPQMRWLVREIHVLRPLRWHSLLRNEINDRQSIKAAVVTKGDHYLADEHRAQRHTLALRDVRYLIRADIEVAAGVDEDVAKFRDMFRRRLSRGQCFQQPYLGCREFACGFGEPEPDDSKPLALDMDVGPMLFDLRFTQNERRQGIAGEPVFFEAALDRGVLRVPPELYEEVVPVCS